MFERVRLLGRKISKRSILGLYLTHSYHRVRAKVLSVLSDEQFAQRLYKRSQGRELNLRNPLTFDERQWWLKLYYRDPLMTRCTDKIEVREYVKEKGLEEILLPLLGIYSNPAEIDWEQLPSAFYLKTNNSSATNIRCDRRTNFNAKGVSRRLALYLRRNHFALSREWNYRDIEPRVLAEPIIETEDTGLVDYRFLCSYGDCKGIFVDVGTADRQGNHRADARRNIYDPDWNLLDVRVTRPEIEGPPIERPERLSDMIRYAEILSEPFPFCRVDFYSPSPDAVIFGEITFFHAGGNNRIVPGDFEFIMGEWIDIERARAGGQTR